MEKIMEIETRKALKKFKENGPSPKNRKWPTGLQEIEDFSGNFPPNFNYFLIFLSIWGYV